MEFQIPVGDAARAIDHIGRARSPRLPLIECQQIALAQFVSAALFGNNRLSTFRIMR